MNPVVSDMLDDMKVLVDKHGLASATAAQLVASAAIFDGLHYVGHAIQNLGNSDAATPMGGLEALGKVLAESVNGLAQAVSDLDNMK